MSKLHCSTARSSLRNIPSPEHGASHRTISKNSGNALEISFGSLFNTIVLALPQRSIFSNKIRERVGCISLATSKPSCSSISEICVDFDPGAAHISKTFIPGLGSKIVTAELALGS